MASRLTQKSVQPIVVVGEMVVPPLVQEPAMFDHGTEGWFLRSRFPQILTTEPRGWFLRHEQPCTVQKKFSSVLSRLMPALSSPNSTHITLTNEHQRAESQQTG